MPIYMVQANYTPEAWSAMIEEPEDRRIAVNNLLAAVGAELHDFYFTYGEYDIIVIFHAPDALTAKSAAITAFAAGHLRESKMTELFSSQEAVSVMEKAGKLSYERPNR